MEENILLESSAITGPYVKYKENYFIVLGRKGKEIYMISKLSTREVMWVSKEDLIGLQLNKELLDKKWLFDVTIRNNFSVICEVKEITDSSSGFVSVTVGEYFKYGIEDILTGKVVIGKFELGETNR